MRPRPFEPVVEAPDSAYVTDRASGQRWHRTHARTLYADTDRSSVVYHSNYLRYFEMGRAALMREVGFPYREVEESGFVYPIVDLAVAFHHPLRYDDPMWIHTRPVDLERVKVTFNYTITHGDTGALVCTGHTRHCALNREGKVTGVDPHTLEMWNAFQEGDAAGE